MGFCWDLGTLLFRNDSFSILILVNIPDQISRRDVVRESWQASWPRRDGAVLSPAMDQEVESFWWEKLTGVSPGTSACFTGENNQERSVIDSFACTVRAAMRCRDFGRAGERIWEMMARVIVPLQPKCCLCIS